MPALRVTERRNDRPVKHRNAGNGRNAAHSELKILEHELALCLHGEGVIYDKLERD
jgi:hypothetical protein